MDQHGTNYYLKTIGAPIPAPPPLPTPQSNENLRGEKRKADNLETNTQETSTNEENPLPKKAKTSKKNSDMNDKNSSKNGSENSSSQRGEGDKGDNGKGDESEQGEGEKDERKENEGESDEEREGKDETGPKKPQKYKRTCECGKRILNWILEDMKDKRTITMAEALSTWGMFWLFLGWKFYPTHLSYFADHMCLVEISEVEKLKRLKAIWQHRDPQSLTRFVMKHLEWFESKEKLWLYGDKQGLDMDIVQLSGGKEKRK